MLSWKLSVLEIPLDKEFTANCLVETRRKLEKLIPAAMVKYGLNRVQLPLVVEAVPDKWFLMVWFVLGHSFFINVIDC